MEQMPAFSQNVAVLDPQNKIKSVESCESKIKELKQRYGVLMNDQDRPMKIPFNDNSDQVN